MKLSAIAHDINSQALWAGLTAFVWYAFGAVPLHIAVAGQLGLTASQSSSWIFIIWTTGAAASIGLSFYYRIPVPITWSIPGLIYLGTLAGEFTFAEIAAANLIAGVMILALGLLGVGERMMKWLPLPIVMGMFAGSIFGYVTRLVTVTVEDVLIAGPTVAGYLLGRLIGNPRIPPVGLAVVFGALAVLAAGQAVPEAMSWSLPSLAVPGMEFSASAFAAISLPMMVLALGAGKRSRAGLSHRPGIQGAGEPDLHRDRREFGDQRVPGRPSSHRGPDGSGHNDRPRRRAGAPAILGIPGGRRPDHAHRLSRCTDDPNPCRAAFVLHFRPGRAGHLFLPPGRLRESIWSKLALRSTGGLCRSGDAICFGGNHIGVMVGVCGYDRLADCQKA